MYENMFDELVVDARTKFVFDRVRKLANQYKIELSEEDFSHLFRLELWDKDTKFMMFIMNKHDLSLKEALVSYICY